MSNLKVAVRVRPISQRELEIKSQSVVSIENGTIAVTNIKVPEHHAGDSRTRVRKFAFDFCYDEESTQDEIFSMIEDEVSNALSNRYHACVLAYGQSSTGKTYTMMGLQDEPGLTPRLCENIFKYFQSSVTEDEIKELRTSVSYLEIYNERVQDLLTPATSGKCLKVREHPKKGPYVQGLIEHQVEDSQQLLFWLSTGNGNRRVAATSNNRRSSRSHSVFTVSCSNGGSSCSRLHLVDLAGSERAHANHGTAAPRLKEGANINRSLVALGNVICALADQSGRSARNSRKRFVPYRDSVLTWLLKETLGGNSKTVMIATISPSSACYSETVNTLRFGQRAKKIVNRPVVNEDAKEKLIRELRAEIQRLKELLTLQQIKTGDSCLEMTESSPKPNQDTVGETDEDSALSQEETDELESSDTLIEPVEQKQPEEQYVDPQKIENSNTNTSESLTPTTNPSPNPNPNLQSYTKTDKLIPVIDITSSVKPKLVKPAKLNRTYSVDFSKSIGKLKKEFGSHETLNSKIKKPLIKESKEADKKSVENLTKIDKTCDSSRSGSISESSGKSTPKKNLIPTKRVHNRSEVVAAVTQRLYSQQNKKKELRKTMDDKPDTPLIIPRQNICSSARIRLQELTQRALRASKRKVHSETQTEVHSIRMKEKSTDVQDINVVLAEVKDANTSTVTSTQSVGVSCLVENYNSTIKLTRSCSCQTEELPKNQSVSFTKYLKNPPLTIHSYTQPIYTSSVNINVSHKFPLKKEEISDDSLEDFTNQNVQYSTPDLISNHNSLEQNCSQKQNTKNLEETLPSQIGNKSSEKFCVCECFATDSAEYCFAESSTEPTANETVSNISFPTVYATEIRKDEEFNETCSKLNETKPESVKPHQSFEPIRVVKTNCFVVNDSKKTKVESNSSTEESDTDSFVFNKKVKSSQYKRKDVIDVLQNLMDEASSLFVKLNSVANQVEKKEEHRNKKLFLTKQKTQSIYRDFDTKDCYVQTYLPFHDASSQTSSRIIDFGAPSSLLEVSNSDFPDNKWEQQVKTSCDKLDQCIKLAEHKSHEEERRKYHSDLFDSLHKFPQPFSTDTECKYCPNEFSSLDTTQSASDYGSLPRREGLFRRNTYRNYSPKAYMKQLVAMRRQIVETSRSDLMEDFKLPASEH